MCGCGEAMDQVKDSVLFGSRELPYTIVYKTRKTLGIYVHPDASIEVIAPEHAPLDKIREHVHRRAAWICRQQRYFESLGIHTPKRLYVSGETHLYLGRQYMLRVKEGSANRVHYQGNVLEVECRRSKDVETLLWAWYRQRAAIKFPDYFLPLAERFKRYGVAPAAMEIKEMKTRWGSCDNAGVISLNIRLICAPRICIEYVILHELCHLVHRNHTKAFYELLSQEMPDWEKWKMKLERLLL